MPSLSQTYRPRRFADVTGQRHVTDTLRAEVAGGSLGQAFLFSGPRGVGKTTCARILAKALGCAQPLEGEPCGTCASCVAFQEGKVFDVIEIDAATHTGVDMVREAIVEHVRFAPAGKRKVYILDEAHMLSTASWNALLKTLEEPPSYAFFVFATTEWHKVPPTIVSRCQRFEFRRIADADMAARLAWICVQQGWTADDAVLKLVASRAEGCLRDAETLLGQIGSLAEDGRLTIATAGLVMPLSAFGQALSWLEYAAEGRTLEAADALRAWYDAGISFATLVDDVLVLLKRLLLAAAVPADAAAWVEGTDEDRRLARLLPAWSSAQIHDAALVLIERRRDLKLGLDPVFVLLLAFTAVCRLRAGGPVAFAPVAPPPRMPEPETAKPAAPAPAVAPAPIPTPAPVPASVSAPSVEAVRIVEQAPVAAPVASPAPAPEVPAVPPDPIAAAMPAPAAPVEAPASAPEPAASSGGAPVLDIAVARRLWNVFIQAVDEQNHSLPFILKISRPERVDEGTLVIRFPYPFHKDKVIGDPKHLRIVEACARKVFGVESLRLDGIVLAPDAEAGQPTSQQDVVGNLLKAFGGSVVEPG